MKTQALLIASAPMWGHSPIMAVLNFNLISTVEYKTSNFGLGKDSLVNLFYTMRWSKNDRSPKSYYNTK